MKKKFFVLAFLFSVSYTYSQNYELPKEKKGSIIIKHTAYTVSFNPTYKIPDWVAYELTKEHTINKFDRGGLNFSSDPLCDEKQATDKDYKSEDEDGIKYQKGHMANAKDMSWDEAVLKESFYYTNCIPQTKRTNTGTWGSIESRVRGWAKKYGKVYVAMGPIYSDGMKTLGDNKVAIPERFYKVVLVYNDTIKMGIGFIVARDSYQTPLKEFAVSIDEIEKITGIDFFYQLPDEIEERIESEIGDFILK